MVCMCVCLSVEHVRELCKTAEPIKMPFGGLTRVDQETILDGVEIPVRQGVILAGCAVHRTALGVSTAVYATESIIQSSITARCVIRLLSNSLFTCCCCCCC